MQRVDREGCVVVLSAFSRVRQFPNVSPQWGPLVPNVYEQKNVNSES